MVDLKTDLLVIRNETILGKSRGTTIKYNFRQNLILFIVGGLLVALYAPTIAWLWNRWTLSVWQDTHGIIILTVSVYIIWNKLRKIRHLPKSESVWGFAFLIPALILHVLDTGMQTQLLSAASLILALPGLSLLFLGVDRTRAIFFPLAFLIFALPIPLAATEPIHLLLRKLVTICVAFIIPRLGIPLFVYGNSLQLPNASLLVADACSGFSTLYTTITVALLVAYTSPNIRRRMIVMLVAAPLAVTANILRSVILVVLVARQGKGIMNTSWHPISGLMTFTLVLIIIFWLGGILQKTGDNA